MLCLSICNDNVTKLLYVDNNIYHGECIVNNSVYDIGSGIFNELIELIGVKHNHQYLYDYQGYQVYYDEINHINHFIKNGREDFNMFYQYNGMDGYSYNGNIKNKLPEMKKFIINGFKISLSLALILTIMLFEPNKIDNINYQKTNSISYVDNVSADEALDLINNSKYLTKDEKAFLSNERLLNDVLPTYKNSSMAYFIRKRLKNIKIVYKKLDSTISGCYTGENVIYIQDYYQNVDLNSKAGLNKRKVLAHEFIHLLQSPNAPYYLKEAMAELISNEYFFETTKCTSYAYAVKNLELLTETIGPKDIWKCVFAGDEKNFLNNINKYLSKEDIKKFDEYLNETAATWKSNGESNFESHRNICLMIEKLYKRIYKQDISSNPNIFTSYGVNSLFSAYIEKKAYFYQYNTQEQSVYFTYDEALQMGLFKNTLMYHYVKNDVSELEYRMYNKLKSFQNDSIYKESFEKCLSVDKNHPLFQKYPIYSHSYHPVIHNNEEYVKFYWMKDGIEKSMMVKLNDAIKDKLVNRIDYKYHRYTFNHDRVPNDMVFVEKKEEKIPIDNTITYNYNEVIKKVETIQERFPNQIIMYQNKELNK